MVRIQFIFALLFLTGGFSQTLEVEKTINDWHEAASNADYETYFGLMSDDAIFIGTDATENWTINEFKAYAKPHFDKGKAWSFTKLERHIFTQPQQNLAWFDELLDTQMGICRGSGILEKKEDTWKIKHYVLSIAIPNENVKEITKLKEKFDKELIAVIKDSKN